MYTIKTEFPAVVVSYNYTVEVKGHCGGGTDSGHPDLGHHDNYVSLVWGVYPSLLL